jgi:hypothetical protein
MTHKNLSIILPKSVIFTNLRTATTELDLSFSTRTDDDGDAAAGHRDCRYRLTSDKTHGVSLTTLHNDFVQGKAEKDLECKWQAMN